jgi:sulfite reductase beta subunit-like hemoprotein
LRGAIAAELANENPAVSKPVAALLKFHGAYQQDDRDQRKRAPVKSYSFMVRVSLPGGIIAPRQYLALDALADTAGDGTLRITSRGGLQYHYVGKRTLRDCIRAINDSGVSTFAACGDVVRNVVAPAEPFETPERQRLDEYARLLNRSFKPQTRAYAEIWLDGEPAATFESESEPLYGDAYLPRKFKFGFAVEGDNTTDIHIHDCGFVAHFEGRELLGFTALAGGGMGQSNGIPGTYPRLADPFCFLPPAELLDVATAAVSIHRDFSDRVNRKRARLKYVIQDRGIEWFGAEMAPGPPAGAAARIEVAPARGLLRLARAVAGSLVLRAARRQRASGAGAARRATGGRPNARAGGPLHAPAESASVRIERRGPAAPRGHPAPAWFRHAERVAAGVAALDGLSGLADLRSGAGRERARSAGAGGARAI